MRHSLFALKHPSVIFTYFGAVIVLCMSTMNPVFVLISLAGSSALMIAAAGIRKWGRTLALFSPAILIISGVNFFLNRVGETILFSWGSWSFSLEALIYGITSSLMLLAIILWFMSYQELMTNDKFLALFSRVAPTTSLVISMIFRYIPQLSEQGRSISLAQKTLIGDTPSNKRGAIAYGARITSILMGWSLEQSIETADSMRARGYGSHKRTTFNPYVFTVDDGVTITLLVVLFALSLGAVLLNLNSIMFYPYFELQFPALWHVLAYSALVLFPFFTEVRGRLS